MSELLDLLSTTDDLPPPEADDNPPELPPPELPPPDHLPPPQTDDHPPPPQTDYHPPPPQDDVHPPPPQDEHHPPPPAHEEEHPPPPTHDDTHTDTHTDHLPPPQDDDHLPPPHEDHHDEDHLPRPSMPPSHADASLHHDYLSKLAPSSILSLDGYDSDDEDGLKKRSIRFSEQDETETTVAAAFTYQLGPSNRLQSSDDEDEEDTADVTWKMECRPSAFNPEFEQAQKGLTNLDEDEDEFDDDEDFFEGDEEPEIPRTHTHTRSSTVVVRTIKKDEMPSDNMRSSLPNLGNVLPLKKPVIRIKSLGDESSLEFKVSKANKFGLKQERILQIDLETRSLKFLSKKNELRSEIPALQVAACVCRRNRVLMTFKERATRKYDIVFASDELASQFNQVFKEIQLISRTKMASSPPNPATVRGLTPTSKSQFSSFLSISRSPTSKSQFSSSLSISSNELERRPTAASTSSNFNATPVLKNNNGMDSDDLFVEDDAFFDYAVIKRNRYQRRQKRIVTLKKSELTLMDSSRKFIKSFKFVDILEYELTKNEGGNELFIVFKSKKQRPFQLFFESEFERMHFAEQSKLNERRLIVHEPQTDEDHQIRFCVNKIVRGGTKKKRILAILPSQRVLRSFNRSHTYKDFSFTDITSVIPAVGNDKRAFAITEKRAQHYDFSDAIQCYKFICVCREVIDAMVIGSFPRLSLLTRMEEKEPTKDLTVFVASWNLGSVSPTADDLEQFVDNGCDIYVFGFQECDSKKMKQVLTSTIQCLTSRDDPYEVIASNRLWEIVIVVVARSTLTYKIANVETGTVPTGLGDVLGNKGGAAVSFMYESTSLCFVVSHLAARFERLQQRRDNYLKIVRDLRLGNPHIDLVSQFHHTIWFGDLNYRTKLPFAETCALVEKRDFKTIVAADQLLGEMSKRKERDRPFPDFQEHEINFPPTYRWERDRNVFSNKKEQSPSYCDRVLWHSNLPDHVDCIKYAGCPNVMGSDHRPVKAEFVIKCRSFNWKESYSNVKINLMFKKLKLTLWDSSANCMIEPQIESSCMIAPGVSYNLNCKNGSATWTQIMVSSFINDIKSLRAYGLRVGMRKNTNHEEKFNSNSFIGHATVALARLEEEGDLKFKHSVLLHGNSVGEISGQLCVHEWQNVKEFEKRHSTGLNILAPCTPEEKKEEEES